MSKKIEYEIVPESDTYFKVQLYNGKNSFTFGDYINSLSDKELKSLYEYIKTKYELRCTKK